MRGRRRTTASPTVTSVIDELPPGGMEINGALLAGDPARDGRTRQGVTVVFTASGILAESPEMTSSRSFSWDSLDSVRCSETTVLPDRRSASVLELLSNGRTVRFLLPADSVSPGQAAYLEQAVPEWLSRYRTVPRSSTVAGPVEDVGAATAVLPVIATPNGRPVVEPVVASCQPTVPPPPSSRPPELSYWPTVPPPSELPPATASVPTNPPRSDPTPEPWPPTGPAPAAGSPVPDATQSLRACPPGVFSDLLAIADSAAPPIVDPSDLGVHPAGTTVTNPWSGLADPPVPDYGAARGTNGASIADARNRRIARRRHRDRAQLVILVVVILVVVAVGSFILLRGRGGVSPQERSQAVALAASTNLRLSDLPAGWVRTSLTATVPPASPRSKITSAVGTLAACVGQPVGTVSGWFGSAPFAGEVATVRSSDFANETAPAVQMFSTTTVLTTTSDLQPSGGAVSTSRFATCLGHYQVAAVAFPSTTRVQTVPLNAPAGVKSYGFVTTFTFPGQGAEVVGDAFVVGHRTATLLSVSTSGATIPEAAFDRAYNAVVARVAGDSG